MFIKQQNKFPLDKLKRHQRAAIQGKLAKTNKYKWPNGPKECSSDSSVVETY